MRLADTGLRFGVSDLQLLFADRVVVLELLLFHQEFAVGGELDPAALSVRTGRIRTLYARAGRISPDALTHATTELVLRSTCGWHNQSLSFFPGNPGILIDTRNPGVKPAMLYWGPESDRYRKLNISRRRGSVKPQMPDNCRKYDESCRILMLRRMRTVRIRASPGGLCRIRSPSLFPSVRGFPGGSP